MLSDQHKKRCHTATAWALHDGKVLLVKHKKLRIWLAPGGHVEENELPHKAAEREFLEETGIQARAISAQPLTIQSQNSEFLPLPFYCNLHDINKPRGDSFCEQHYSWAYFVQVDDVSTLHENDDGVDAVRWFLPSDLSSLETTEGIRNEARYVFENFPRQV